MKPVPKVRPVFVLVLIVIVMLMAAGVAVMIRGMTDPPVCGRKTTVLIKMLDMGCQIYKVDYGVYPPHDAGDSRCLHRYLGFKRLVSAKDGSVREKPPVVEFKADMLAGSPDGPPVPVVDRWGRPIRYANPGVKNLKGVDIWSAGMDGVDGTDDDITNWPESR